MLVPLKTKQEIAVYVFGFVFGAQDIVFCASRVFPVSFSLHHFHALIQCLMEASSLSLVDQANSMATYHMKYKIRQ